MVGTKVTAPQGAGEQAASWQWQADALSLSSEPNWPGLLDAVPSAHTSRSGLGAQGPVWMPVPQGTGQRTQEVWGFLLPARPTCFVLQAAMLASSLPSSDKASLRCGLVVRGAGVAAGLCEGSADSGTPPRAMEELLLQAGLSVASSAQASSPGPPPSLPLVLQVFHGHKFRTCLSHPTGAHHFSHQRALLHRRAFVLSCAHQTGRRREGGHCPPRSPHCACRSPALPPSPRLSSAFTARGVPATATAPGAAGERPANPWKPCLVSWRGDMHTPSWRGLLVL